MFDERDEVRRFFDAHDDAPSELTAHGVGNFRVHQLSLESQI
jgi:hypothetical protein